MRNYHFLVHPFHNHQTGSSSPNHELVSQNYQHQHQIFHSDRIDSFQIHLNYFRSIHYVCPATKDCETYGLVGHEILSLECLLPFGSDAGGVSPGQSCPIHNKLRFLGPFDTCFQSFGLWVGIQLVGFGIRQPLGRKHMVDQHTQEAEENDEQTQAAKTTQKEPNEEQEIKKRMSGQTE